MARKNAKKPVRDEDNPELTESFFRKARPAREMFPDLVKNPPKIGRPRVASPLQVVAVRIPGADAETFRAQGKGWQKLARGALEREAKRLRAKRGTARPAKQGKTRKRA